jgi:versiconal hemiacetal acetate esterase
LVGFRPLIHGPTIENLLKEWNEMGVAFVQKLTFPTPDTSVKTEDRTIDGGIKTRIYTPQAYVSGSSPIGLYIHGGGWAMGDLETDDSTCRAISKDAGVVLVSVDYRLAPQYKYPTGLDDCVTAFKWTLENATSLGGIPGRVFIAGASAGGGSTFAVALRVVDEGNGGSLAGLVSQVPCVIHPDVVPQNLRSKYTSYHEHEENTVNTKSAMLTFWGK